MKNIFATLGLPPSADKHRRVMAVLTFLKTPSSHHPRIPAGPTAKTPAARLGTAPRTWLPYRHEPARPVAGEDSSTDRVKIKRLCRLVS